MSARDPKQKRENQISTYLPASGRGAFARTKDRDRFTSGPENRHGSGGWAAP